MFFRNSVGTTFLGKVTAIAWWSERSSPDWWWLSCRIFWKQTSDSKSVLLQHFLESIRLIFFSVRENCVNEKLKRSFNENFPIIQSPVIEIYSLFTQSLSSSAASCARSTEGIGFVIQLTNFHPVTKHTI
jgi:hypothetical protein